MSYNPDHGLAFRNETQCNIQASEPTKVINCITDVYFQYYNMTRLSSCGWLTDNVLRIYTYIGVGEQRTFLCLVMSWPWTMVGTTLSSWVVLKRQIICCLLISLSSVCLCRMTHLCSFFQFCLLYLDDIPTTLVCLLHSFTDQGLKTNCPWTHNAPNLFWNYFFGPYGSIFRGSLKWTGRARLRQMLHTYHTFH